MKRAILITIIFTFLFSSSAFGQFKDVPVGHWSNKALYDLVRMGITQGYPDGTFRGNKLMTRYEIAIFLSKLAAILETKGTMQTAVDEKLVAEFKAELASLRSQLKETKEIPEPEISGSIMFRFRQGSTLSGTRERTSRVDYRLKTKVRKDFKNGISAQVELDTLDAGFGGENERGIATHLLNAKGTVKFDTRPLPLKLGVTVGPNLVFHRESDPALVSEDYMVFAKPKTAVELSTATYGMDLSISYVARNPSISGEVSVHEITATTGFTVFHVPLLNKLRLYLTPRYLFAQDESIGVTHDVRGETKFEIVPSEKFKTKLVYGVGSPDQGNASYLNLGLIANDIFNTGTYIVVEGHTVDGKYRIANFDKYEFVPRNFFDKLILDGTSDIGVQVIQNITKSLDFVFKADEILTRDFKYGSAYEGTSLTMEGGLSYAAAPDTMVDIFVRTYDVPSGVAYALDPLLRTNVAKHSVLFGAVLTYTF